MYCRHSERQETKLFGRLRLASWFTRPARATFRLSTRNSLHRLELFRSSELEPVSSPRLEPISAGSSDPGHLLRIQSQYQEQSDPVNTKGATRENGSPADKISYPWG